MANRKITDHTAITGANTATGDLFEIVDVSDATDAASGTNKKITRAELAQAVAQESVFVQSSLFDANTILAANSDNTPAALTVAEQRIVGRVTGGNIAALTGAQVGSVTGAWRTLGPFAFAYNTASILTGISLGPTLAAGTVFHGFFISISTVWNGTTPKATCGLGDTSASLVGSNIDMTSEDVTSGNYDAPNFGLPAAAGSLSNFLITAPVQFSLLVDNGAGGNPNPSQGAANLYIVVAAPASS